MSATAALSSQSVLVIGTVKNLCESSPCDRRLVKLAEKFETSVRQLLEHNHRYNRQIIYFMLLVLLSCDFAGLRMLHGSILMFKCRRLLSFHHQATCFELAVFF
jgi:hypothetical protein